MFVAAVGEEGMVRTLEARENITTDSDCNGTSEFHTTATLGVGEHSFHSI